MRAGLYGKNPAAVAAAAARIGELAASLPIEGTPFSTREIAVSDRLTQAAQTLPTPELAIRRITLEEGLDPEEATGLAPVLLAAADTPDGGDGEGKSPG